MISVTRSAMIVLALAAWANLAPGQAKSSVEKPLSAIEWLVGDWHSSAVDPDTHKSIAIDNHIYWSETHTAIYFLTKFDGIPHYTGMYIYDPARKVIAFYYSDSEGNFTQGTARYEGSRLLQDFTTAHMNDRSTTLHSSIDPAAGHSRYHWEVTQPGAAPDAKPLIALDYSRSAPR